MLNKVILMGRLTADPEHKQTPNGVSVTSFSIAVERNFADKQTGKREADFINIVAWRGTADLICKYFSKGRLIALDGSLQTRTYQDNQGQKRYVSEVVADNVYFTGEKKDSSSSDNSNNNYSQRPATFTPPQSETFQEPAKGTGFSVGDFEEIDTDDSELPF